MEIMKEIGRGKVGRRDGSRKQRKTYVPYPFQPHKKGRNEEWRAVGGKNSIPVELPGPIEGSNAVENLNKNVKPFSIHPMPSVASNHDKPLPVIFTVVSALARIFTINIQAFGMENGMPMAAQHSIARTVASNT
ncbi:hypothetical protein IEQ34_004568 [Dendrobium chrysotoxum]|uniref:Uncharacterized protein n=1 Tax=Dendrobium chrysotoxum TaxID=161865 RepID=A0AAV7HJ56_DENCH|nr:hypothetical protein IEQ34_004568 [Dendrobium chrysotoxum]